MKKETEQPSNQATPFHAKGDALIALGQALKDSSSSMSLIARLADAAGLHLEIRLV